MKKIRAIPLVGVGAVEFGMKRTEVRSIFGKATEFKKSKFSKTTTDDFGFCHVFYNTKDECEAIEIFNDVEVEIDGIVVFPTNIERLSAICADLMKDDSGYISVGCSIGIYAPDGAMESILFATRGYYE